MPTYTITRKSPRQATIRRRLLPLVTTTLLGFISLQSQAHNTVYELDISARPVLSALTSLSAATGVQIVNASNQAITGNAPSLSGSYTLEQALTGLLSNNEQLIWERIDPHTIRILPADGENRQLTLDPLDILGTSNPAFEQYHLPGSTHSITREQLDRVPYSSPGDIFKDIPGVVAAGGRNGVSIDPNIRGLQGSSRVKTLIDGSMQNTSQYRGYSGFRDQTFVDPDLIGGITVQKGPNAGPQGSGAIGGVVSIRTLEADDLLMDGQNYGLRLRGSYGNNVASGDICNSYRMYNSSYGSFCFDRNSGKILSRTPGMQSDAARKGVRISDENWSGSIAGAWRPLDNWEIVAAHSKRISGNYKAGDRGAGSWKGAQAGNGYGHAQSRWPADGEVMNTSQNTESYLLKNRIRFLDDHTLDLGYINYKNYSGEVTSLSVWGNFVQDELSSTETSTYTARYAWQPDSQWIDLRASLWKSDVESYIASLHMASNIETIGLEIWNTSHLNVPVGQLALTYGVSLADETVRNLSTAAMTTPSGDRVSTGLFGRGEWEVNRWLAVNAGIRRDRTRLKSRDAAQASRSFKENSPSYGLTITPIEPLQLFAQWSDGTRAPTLRETYMSGSVIPNPNLRPETAKTFEYGVNLSLSGLLFGEDRLGIKFARFDNKYQDMISRVRPETIGMPPASSMYVWGNIDKAVYKGYEISLDYDMGWAFLNYAITRYDSIDYCYNGYSNYQMVYSCWDRPGANDYGASYMPATQSENATLGLRLLDRRLTLGLRINSSTESPNGGSNAGSYRDNLIWQAYEIYDLFGGYQVNRNLDIGFSIENLRDRFYMDNLTNNMEALPSPGRTSRVTVTARF